MPFLRPFIFLALLAGFCSTEAVAQKPASEICARPAAGSAIGEPESLRSQNGVLRVELSYRNFLAPDGHMRYCYVSKDGSEAPTLRLSPGDLLVLSLKNDLIIPPQGASKAVNPAAMAMPMVIPDACASKEMTASSTNLHFH